MAKNIGILGGSFNPAHDGHLYISEKAIEFLGLDEVWWLVSPQNPLKSEKDTAPFDDRIDAARKLASGANNIIISDFEANTATNYTYDNLLELKAANPGDKFIWLMGADNLINFHKWHRWKEIFNIAPIAVFDRNMSAQSALASDAAIAFSKNKVNPDKLIASNAPAWSFIEIESHPASSTKIRDGSSI